MRGRMSEGGNDNVGRRAYALNLILHGALPAWHSVRLAGSAP